ncbi:MAG: HIT family protein [Bacteroidota bacterium]
MPSIFTRIVNGEIPCYKLAENEEFLAFLDINPLVKGHALVIPKLEVDYIFDLEDELLGRLHIFAKKVALAIEQVCPCERMAIAVLGLEVPHAHVHLAPIMTESDIDFRNRRVKLSHDEFVELAAQISSVFNA